MHAEVLHGGLHPMKVKKDLAASIVRDFHGAAAAEAAAESWAKQFQQRTVSDDIPVVEISLSTDGLAAEPGVVRMPKLLVAAGLAASTGEATRKLAENAVSVNGEKHTDKTLRNANAGESFALRLGKRSVRVQFAD
jgi:tyrosyl-tRNA synthetase